jgi:hypothetical protein
MRKKWEEKMNNDPWKDLKPPNAADAINAKRVDVNIPWGFFWARSVDHKCLLILRHSEKSSPRNRLPKLKGVDVFESEYGPGGDRMLVLKLADSAHRDIFHRLCKDIVESASLAASEIEAVEVTLARTWRWHHLLRGGSDGRLTPEEQKGLIGELLFLERYLLEEIQTVDAVSSWRGPLDSPKDFEVGRVCIEAKARRGASKPYISINSEYQLDNSGVDHLFLFVVELDRSPAETKEGVNVNDVSTRVRNKIESQDIGALNPYEDLLAATGFRWEDDYSDYYWTEGLNHIYQVTDDFPRIIAGKLQSGVLNVKYSISLTECEPFITEDGKLKELLG